MTIKEFSFWHLHLEDLKNLKVELYTEKKTKDAEKLEVEIKRIELLIEKASGSPDMAVAFALTSKLKYNE